MNNKKGGKRKAKKLKHKQTWLKKQNFIYFTTITKQVIQLILITLAPMFAFGCSGVPGGNPPVW